MNKKTCNESKRLGTDIKKIWPLIEYGQSDQLVLTMH